VEVTQGIAVVGDVPVCVHVLGAHLGGELRVSHQSRGPSPAPTQMLQVVDGLHTDIETKMKRQTDER